MRSKQLDLTKYSTDKIESQYLIRYDSILEPWINQNIVLLELGVYQGESLLLWRDYFPRSTIVGVDIKLPKDFNPPDRVFLFEGSQTDTKFLSSIANEIAPDGLDIIIDDASHIGEFTKIAFWHLFDHHLKANGLYIIEDWGTGYWDDWVDGKSLNLDSYLERPSGLSTVWANIKRRLGIKIPAKSHSYGMVGLIKQLVDEQAAHDITRKKLGGKSRRGSKFDHIIIAPSLVFIKKAAQ